MLQDSFFPKFKKLLLFEISYLQVCGDGMILVKVILLQLIHLLSLSTLLSHSQMPFFWLTHSDSLSVNLHHPHSSRCVDIMDK